jgi:beta-glucanase (GH16 family)
MLPTVWNLGDGKRPDNGEIDIMEYVGYEPGLIHASTHSRKNQWRNNTQRTAITEVPDAGMAFHTYALEWDPEEIRIFVDDRHYFTSR